MPKSSVHIGHIVRGPIGRRLTIVKHAAVNPQAQASRTSAESPKSRQGAWQLLYNGLIARGNWTLPLSRYRPDSRFLDLFPRRPTPPRPGAESNSVADLAVTPSSIAPLIFPPNTAEIGARAGDDDETGEQERVKLCGAVQGATEHGRHLAHICRKSFPGSVLDRQRRACIRGNMNSTDYGPRDLVGYGAHPPK